MLKPNWVQKYTIASTARASEGSWRKPWRGSPTACNPAFTIPKSGSKMNPNSRPSAAADATNGTRKQVR